MQSKPSCYVLGNLVKLSHLLHVQARDERTRAITANSTGKLEWVERLVLELKGPIGTPQLMSAVGRHWQS